MIQYLIQVVAFQLLFLIAYDVFLKKETFFQWNRIYLIFSSLISFLLPFIKIESLQKAVPQEYVILLPEIVLTPEKTVEVIAPSWNWYLIIGIVVSSLLFTYKIVQLIRLKLKGIIVHKGSYNIIKIPNSTTAFSIFNYVFMGTDIREEKLQDILSHELVHIREKHSIDLLYFELLRILCWFNPLVYIYQKRISEVHEYIADQSVINENNKSDYYEKLLAEVFQTQQFSFTSQFYKHSLIKKRIMMLTKQRSRQILKLKYLVLVPVLIISLLYTSCEKTTVIDAEETTEAVDETSKKELLQELIYELNSLNITSQEQQAVLFNILDKVPVFPGCEGEGTLEGLKDCFALNMRKHISENFNTALADNIQLKGVIKIYTKFIIDENGAVTGMNVRAAHPDLVTEVERVLQTLPRLTPGEKDGKPVSVKYILPIAFKIQ